MRIAAKAVGVCLSLGTAVALAPSVGATDLDLNGQAQQQSEWCWAATGDSIASFWGKNVSQNVFCNLAFDLNPNGQCPNQQATLANDQEAFYQLGINPGTYISGRISASQLNDQIQQGKPVNTRIGWTSGGGHMMALYGYDASTGNVSYYNPWPTDSRYNTSSYDWYTGNSSFTWTHTLYNIGG